MKKGWIIVGALGFIAWGVWGALVFAPRVFATGSLTIPNTIAAQPTGDLQASLLDTNWTTIANYINVRELTSDTLSNRPAAGTSGRLYFATDDNGGTLYADDGASWDQLAPGVTAAGAGGYGSRGLKWSTATSTNTTYNGTADVVILRNPSTGAVIARTATTTVSNNIIATSPAANARDSATAFTGPTWVHFYYIWNGSTLASLSSLCAPSTTTGSCSSSGGPVLPSGHTHWGYIGPVRLATAGTLNATWIEGSKAAIEPTTFRAPAAGTGAEQSYDLSTFVAPPNHLGVDVSLVTNRCDLQNDVRTAASGRVVLASAGAGTNIQCSVSGRVPLSAQTLYFIGNAASTVGLIANGYRVPNGGE